jgi:outer membrane receptor protein involved in Fe transport
VLFRSTRDASGKLTSIGVRPVNFAGTEREELRWGLNYSKALGALPPAKGGQAAKGARPQGGGARPGQGLLQLSLYHTWYLANRITIRPGMAALDLLNGAAVGKRGGQPRHEVQLQAGYFKDGMGARLNGAWRARTWVDGGVNGQDLYFSDLATLNVQMFADLSNRKDLVKKYAWAKGARLSFNVDNLFDEKQSVKDIAGVTPQAYQPDYMDPVGRTVRLSVRKLFG